jgi:hypothetical protein
MKHTKSVLTTIIATSVLSANVYAASIDFRHEYKGKTDQHASRVKMGNTFENNLSLDLELKFKGKDGDFMQDLQQNGSEIGINYKYAINNEWALQPGMPIEFGTGNDDRGNVTYKPQLRVTYTPDAVDSLSLSGRYRLDIKPGQSDEDGQDKKYRNRFTFNAGYSIDNLRLGLEMNYYKSHDSSYILYDDKDTNYENNITAHYKMGDWTPWVEFGDVSVDSTKDTRELRSRVGIRYSF